MNKKEIEKLTLESYENEFSFKEKNILKFEKEILEKFNYLLEIENLSRKL